MTNDPFTYFKPEDEAVYKEVQEFYDLSLPFKGFLSRGKEATKKKNLYFTTEQVRQVVETNVERLRMINTGVKAFIKCEDKGSRSFTEAEYFQTSLSDQSFSVVPIGWLKKVPSPQFRF